MIEMETVTTFLMIGILLGIASAIAYKANLIQYHGSSVILQGSRQGHYLGFGDLRESLAVMLLVMLLITLLSSWMFGSLAEDIINHDSITQFDVTFGNWLLNGTTKNVTEFYFGVTTLGSWATIGVGVVIIGFLLLVQKKWSQIATLLAVVGGGSLLNWLLKNIFMRPRPNFPNALYHESSYSFPSGHAMTAVLFYGIAAYLISRSITNWKWKSAFALLSVAIVLLIGISRLYLGVHFLTDVLGGWAAGLAWLTACLMASGLYKYHLLAKSDAK